MRIGHLWIFSNEVDTKETPLNSFTPGQTVTVTSSSGEKFGNAYINPHALICARLFSHDSRQPLDSGLLQRQLGNALQLRQSYFEDPYYRLVYGESDYLPGLIVDRFENALVVQTSTLGMDLIQSQIIDVLDSTLTPETIII